MIEFNKYYLQLFRKIFGAIDEDSLQLIYDTGKKLEVERGGFLFRQGDKENTLFIVLSGRFRALTEKDGTTQILGDIGEGEPIGEFALFTENPRTASVMAIRKSLVLQIQANEYMDLVAKIPVFASVLTKFVIDRLQRNIFEQNKSSPPKNIVVLNLQKENSLKPWIEDVKKCFQDQQVPIQVYFPESAGEFVDEAIFQEMEQHEGLNFLICDDSDESWSHQCLIYSDLIIVATDFYANPGLYEIEKNLELYSQNILNKKLYLLLLHPENGPKPANTASWLKPRQLSLHIHFRHQNEKDKRRFCRIVTNKGVGLVLGGGGTKGYAHFGVMRALRDAGIEIDFLGGTSAGAIYGILMSHADFDFRKIDQIGKDSADSKMFSKDMDLPIISFMTGRKIKKFFVNLFRDDHMEDIWVNSYCVSTNFSRATSQVHKEGLIWKRILASISIPGIFPPVVIDNELHVDGAVFDNLPVETMYSFPVGHIIAVALAGFTAKKVDFDETPSSWAVLWDKILNQKKYKALSLSSILFNSLTINSRQKQEGTKSKVSLYFELNLRGASFLASKNWINLRSKGHEQTAAFLDALDEKDKFWLKGELKPLQMKN